MPYSLSSLDSLPCLDRFPPVIGIVVILMLAVLFAYGYYQFKGVVAGMGSAKAKHNLTTLNNLFYRFFFLAVIVLIMIVLCKYLAMKLLRLRYGMLYALRQRQNTCPPHYVPKPVDDYWIPAAANRVLVLFTPPPHTHTHTYFVAHNTTYAQNTHLQCPCPIAPLSAPDVRRFFVDFADIVLSREAIRKKSSAAALCTSMTFIVIPASFLTFLLSSYVDSTISGASKRVSGSGSTAKTTNVGASGNGSTTQTRTGGTTKGNSISPGDTTQGDTTMGNDDDDEKGSAMATINVDAEGKV